MESPSNRSTPFTPETVSRCRATRVMRWPPRFPRQPLFFHGHTNPVLSVRVWVWPISMRGEGRSSTEGGHFPAPVVGAFTNLGAQRPGGPPARRGPHFSREMGRKRAGAPPLDPGFHSRSFPLAGFCGGYLCNGRGAISSGMLRPIWDAFSRGNILESIFCERGFPNQGTYMGHEIVQRPEQCGTTAKTSECQRAGHKPGGRGASPATFASRLSLEKALIPARDRAETTSQVLTCEGPNRTTCRYARDGPPSVGRHIGLKLLPGLWVVHKIEGAELLRHVVVADHPVPADVAVVAQSGGEAHQGVVAGLGKLARGVGGGRPQWRGCRCCAGWWPRTSRPGGMHWMTSPSRPMRKWELTSVSGWS